MSDSYLCRFHKYWHNEALPNFEHNGHTGHIPAGLVGVYAQAEISRHLSGSEPDKPIGYLISRKSFGKLSDDIIPIVRGQ